MIYEITKNGGLCYHEENYKTIFAIKILQTRFDIIIRNLNVKILHAIIFMSIISEYY